MSDPRPALRVARAALEAPAGLRLLFARPWALASLRKPAACYVCRRHLAPGDRAYRPLMEGSQTPRHARVCERCGAERGAALVAVVG